MTGRQVLVDAERLERLIHYAELWLEVDETLTPESVEEVDSDISFARLALTQSSQLQAILDAPRLSDLSDEQRTNVVARHVASSQRLSGIDTTPEQVKGHLKPQPSSSAGEVLDKIDALLERYTRTLSRAYDREQAAGDEPVQAFYAYQQKRDKTLLKELQELRALAAAQQQPTPERRFQPGDYVRKKGAKGQWHGRVCGFYSTSITPEGYAVESVFEKGSVQIYPASGLEAWEPPTATAPADGGEG